MFFDVRTCGNPMVMRPKKERWVVVGCFFVCVFFFFFGCVAMDAPDNWCTIESDPGVFTELIANIGVKDVQVEELYDLEDDSLENLKPVYGLIFLFKWKGDTEKQPVDHDSPLFFANQVINNACATQAILSILLNVENIDIGPELTQFKQFTADFPPEMKGLAISNSDLIRKVHNSFHRQEVFVAEKSREATKDDDVYHFVSYLEHQGVLYELDGLKPGPINLGKCTKENWLSVVKPIITRRIEKYSSSEIRFNLMAVVQNKLTVLGGALAMAEEELEEAQAVLQSFGEDMSVDASSQGESPKSAQEKVVAELEDKVQNLKKQIELEKEKHEKWRIENIRRKHNYLPFCVNLLKVLAQKGVLQHLIEKSKQEKSN